MRHLSRKGPVRQRAFGEFDELERLAYPTPGTGVRVVAGGHKAARAVSDVHGVVAEDQACQRLAGETGTVGVVRGCLSHARSLPGCVRIEYPISPGPFPA